MRKLTTEEFIKRANKAHNNKYDYSKAKYINSQTKVTIICPIHGEFEQEPEKHYGKRKFGCPSCSNRKKLTTKEFIERAREVHGDKYDYSKVNYVNNKTKVCIICPKHGKFWQTLKDHITRGSNCPKCNIYKKLTTEDFIEKAKKVHGDKYDYSKVNYINQDTKVTIICPIHGEFKQLPPSHTNRKGNCPECAKKIRGIKQRFTTKEFIERARKVHGDKYDYSKVNYIDTHTKVCIICPKHGKFWQEPNNHIIGKKGCIKCSNNFSQKEKDLLSFIKSIYKGKIINNSKSIIPPLELDIYIPEHSLAIEFDGLYWHSELYKDKNYHLNKTKLCEEKGIRLIHIFEDEWEYRLNIVKARIKHALRIYNYKVYARKCEVYQIENGESKEFLESYHIQGNCSSSVKLGLYSENKLAAVMTFGKCRFSKEYEYELLRYCCLADYNVIGGAGKLLKAFERGWEPKSIVSYCDLRWGTGNLYKQLGFKYSHNSKPTYQYFQDNKKKVRNRESRIKYQKHKLHKKLENFISSLSEHENMLNNNYLRIYDCGNMVFIKEY